MPWVGFRIHVCPHAFAVPEVHFASTLVHEHSHLYDGTQFLKRGERYCVGGCPPDLSPAEAVNTADAYSEFAEEVYARGL